MNGALNPSAIIAAQLLQPQEQPRAPFQWGQGGRRMTPEDIARERQIATRQMDVDYSPVSHWTQGLARVAENLIGGLRSHDADKAARSNADYSAQITQSLLNPSGTPSDSAPAGANPPVSAGNLYQIMSDPFVDPSVKAIAEMQLGQQQKMAMKQFEYANREQPEIVQLANIARDAAQPAEIRKAAQDRITALNDPTLVIPGLPTGTYVGPRSGVGMAFGQAPDDAPDTLPPDFFDNDNSVPPIGATPARANVMGADEYQMFVNSMGKDAADRWIRSQGISVGGR